MSEKYKDYKCEYCKTNIAGKEMLFIILHTAEFGDLKSRLQLSSGDQKIDTVLMDSIADDLIDEYEDRLKYR